MRNQNKSGTNLLLQFLGILDGKWQLLTMCYLLLNKKFSAPHFSIQLEFQTDCNVYFDLQQMYLALKLNLVKGRGFDT